MTNITGKQTEKQRINCLIVDDEPIAIEGIISYIEKLDFLNVASSCSSAIEAADILKEKDIDLMFLDINMPHLTGLEFLESLKKAPLTILTTAYSEYALEGFRLNVVDYLLKPIDFQRFFQAATKARDIFNTQLLPQKNEESNQTIYIRQGDLFMKIAWNDILYVEGMQNYLKIHLINEVRIIHQTMNSLEELLPSKSFFRTHRSYLVNISHITSISKSRVFVRNKELPLSVQNREKFLKTVVYNNLISK